MEFAIRLTSPILTVLWVSFFGFQENAFSKVLKRITQNTPRKGPLFGQMGCMYQYTVISFFLHICIYIQMRTHTHTRSLTRTTTPITTPTGTPTCTRTHTNVCINVYIYIYTCLRIYMSYVYGYVHMGWLHLVGSITL